MSKRAFYYRQDVLAMEAAARMYNEIRLRCDKGAAHYVLLDYLTDLRKLRRINQEQWQVGYTLAGEWHGTAEDFLAAIKELA